MNGVVLFAHGARDPAWARPFEAVADELRRLGPELQVRLAFLELMAPDLPAAVDDLVARGCRTITVVPLFLGAGGHVRKDLPALVERCAARHPAVHFGHTIPVGETPAVIAAMAGVALAMARGAGD